MPEPTTATVAAPASTESTAAPATPATPAAAPTAPRAADVDIETLSPGSKEYQDWRMGKLPKAGKTSSAVKEEESVTSTDAKDPAAPSGDSATPDAKSTQKPNLKTSEDTERRFHELVEDRGRLKQQLETLQEQIRQLTADEDPGSQPDGEMDEVKAPRMDDLDESGQPKYQTIGEFYEALRSYDREQILKEVESRQAKTQEAQRQAEVERTINDGWKKRVADAAKKYPDYDAVALNKDLKIPAGSLLEAFLLDSEQGAHVLYELGKNPAELQRIAEIKNPQRAFRELLKIESKFSTTEKTTAPANKTITAAPPPPHEIGGTGTILPDEVEQAAKDAENDPQAVRRFIEADTRRALAKRKGK